MFLFVLVSLVSLIIILPINLTGSEVNRLMSVSLWWPGEWWVALRSQVVPCPAMYMFFSSDPYYYGVPASIFLCSPAPCR